MAAGGQQSFAAEYWLGYNIQGKNLSLNLNVSEKIGYIILKFVKGY